jgi:hypothetical protein
MEKNQLMMAKNFRKFIERLILEYRSRRSIEWKMDWLLDKIENGEYVLGKKDDETGLETEGAFLKKLYKYPVPTNYKLYDARHEYNQLMDKIVHQDELAELHSAYFGKYTLTIKGRIFRGYVNEKNKECIHKYVSIATGTFALIATFVAIIVGLSEIGLITTSKQQKEPEQKEAMQVDSIPQR